MKNKTLILLAMGTLFCFITTNAFAGAPKVLTYVPKVGYVYERQTFFGPG